MRQNEAAKKKSSTFCTVREIMAAVWLPLEMRAKMVDIVYECTQYTRCHITLSYSIARHIADNVVLSDSITSATVNYKNGIKKWIKRPSLSYREKNVMSNKSGAIFRKLNKFKQIILITLL